MKYAKPYLLFFLLTLCFGLFAQAPALRIQTGHSNTINDLAFSLDGRFLASAGKDQLIVLWDVATGKQFQRLEGHTASVTAITFHPFKPVLASVAMDSWVIVWDYITGQIMTKIVLPEAGLTDVTFSADGTKLYCCNNYVYQVNWAEGTTKRLSYFKAVNGFTAIKCSPNGQYLAIGGAKEPKTILYDLKNDLYVKRINAKANDFYYSADNRFLFAAGNDATMYKWDLENLSSVKNFALIADRMWYKFLSVSVNDKFFAGANRNGLVYVYRAKNGAKRYTLNGHYNPVRALAADSAGLLLATAGDDNYIAVWNFSKGEIVKPLWGTGRDLNTIALSTDSGKVITGYTDGSVAKFDLQLKEPSKVFKLRLTERKVINGVSYAIESILPVDSVSYNLLILKHKRSNKDSDVFKNEKYFTTVWNTKSNSITKLERFKRKPSDFGAHKCLAVASSDFRIEGRKDGKLIYKRNKEHNETLEISILSNGGYIIQNNSGYYTASKTNMEFVNFVLHDKVYPFNQFDFRFNRPDKIYPYLGLNDTSLVNSYYRAWQKRVFKLGIDTTAFREALLVPECDIKNRDQIAYEQTERILKINIAAYDSSFVIDRFNVWINDVPLFGQRGLSVRSKNLNKLDTVVYVTLSEGENKIEASVINSNSLESFRRPLYVKYIPAKPAKEKVYFVGIGIDKFRQAEHNLQYSVKDIRDLTTKFKGIYKDNFKEYTLFDEQVTYANIIALKDFLYKTTVDDKVILAYSGHGLLSDQLDYYLSTYYVDFAKPENGGLPYEQLEWLLDSIPARKKLMLIDACHSGEVDKEDIVRINQTIDSLLLADNGTKGAHIKYTGNSKKLGLKNSFELMQELFADVKRGTGATVIAASGGTQFAQESGNLKNGVFTYSILELMQKKNSIKVTELKDKIGKRVEELTGGNQQPTSRAENVEYNWIVW